VFYEDSVLETKSSTAELRDKLDRFKAFKAYQRKQRDQIQRVEAYLAESEINSENMLQVERALSLLKTLQNHQIEDVPPIRISAFYMGSTMLLWPAMYTFLAWLVFIFPPSLETKKYQTVTLRNAIFLTLATDIIYRCPTWFRNTPVGQEGRISYGANNFDLDPYGFVVQETLGIMVAFLVAVVLLQWSAYYVQTKSELSSMPTEGNYSPRVG
jgi:hypothetical protein